ncbi:MAG: hypothetical protein K6T31_04780 [Alicyclobacillus sp.]|nr:hypothetical protein [Alicyclobacillus sp.]
MSHADLLNLPVAAVVSPHKCYSGQVHKAGADYLLLAEPELGMFLVALEHVKQLRLGVALSDVRPPHIDARGVDVSPQALPETLAAVLQAWTGSVVQLDVGGLEPLAAYLLAVRGDFLLACVVPEGVVYVPLRHVQLVRPLAVQVQPEFAAWVRRQQTELPAAVRLSEALQAEAGRLLVLGRGPEALCGLIRKACAEYVEVVVSPHSCVRVPLQHVRFVARGLTAGLPVPVVHEHADGSQPAGWSSVQPGGEPADRA